MTHLAASDVIKLLNDMPGASIKIPNYSSLLCQTAANMIAEKAMYLFFCKSCDEIVEDGQICDCGAITKKESKKNNFMIYFRLMPQIQQILTDNFAIIMEYLHRDRVQDSISDVDDAMIFRKLRETYTGNELLTLTMNIDGASIFRYSFKNKYFEFFFKLFTNMDMSLNNEWSAAARTA